MTTRHPLKRSHSGEACSSGSSPEKDSLGPSAPKRIRSGNHQLALREPAPLSGDVSPPRKRKKQLTYEEAIQGTEEPVRVYADGVFDVFHSGHARALMQAKNTFPNTYLMVGVTNDEMTHRLKGNTVCTEAERYDSLRHCRYVDEVVTDAPWTLTPEFLEEHQIDFVAHDDLPYNCGDMEDIYKPIKEMGKFVAIQRTPGVSTSDLIARIVRDYDMYVRRNLARGYSAKDLNVGFIKEKEVRFRERMHNLKTKMGGKLGEWEGKSKDAIAGFMGLFGKDGRISEFFHGQKEKMLQAFSPMGTPDQSFSDYLDESDEEDTSPTATNYYTPEQLDSNGQGSSSQT